MRPTVPRNHRASAGIHFVYGTSRRTPLQFEDAHIAKVAPLTLIPHRFFFALLPLALITLAPILRADIGVMVADPTNLNSIRYTTAGHALVYLSGVCADTPIHARLCNPGEQGSVVSMYPDFRETQPYAWNLVPLSLYLQGSLTPGDRLLYASIHVKQALELHAREHFFRTVCSDKHCPQLPHSYWRDMIAATADRDIFLYAVRTTRQQDQSAVAWLNHDRNIAHYHALTNNCADFVSSLINFLFPHSVHRDLLNDVGMMTPKAAARSFTLWALKSPELDFYTMHFAQQPGNIARSGLARYGTETVIHSKKYLVPAIVLGDWELPTSIAASYLFTGRFSLYNEYTRHASPSSPAANAETEAEQPEVIGSRKEWADFRACFAAIQSSPEARVLVPNNNPSRKQFFPALYGTATINVDADGSPWLTPDPTNPTRHVGLSSQNLLAPGSDPQLAFQLMLGRVSYALSAKNRMRESMTEFRQDWILLQQAQSRLRSLPRQTLAQQTVP